MGPSAFAESERFQPGQLGLCHLLGATTLAAVIFGVSAARWRSMQPLEVLLVAAHWAVVLSIAGVIFYFGSRRRRRDRKAAGNLLLRVLCRPMTERRRTIIKWTLTVAVVLDGIFISTIHYPLFTMPTSGATFTRFDALMSILRGVMPQTAFWEGMLWGWCLSHWVANVYWVEFCDNGILTYDGYCPWKGMSRLGWSTVHPQRLVFFQRGHIRQLTIDPASHAAVSELLEQVGDRNLSASA